MNLFNDELRHYLRPASTTLTDPELIQRRLDAQIARSRQLVAALNLDLPPLILIGGTSGKGSVAIMCEAILRAHGLRTGLYLSPFLQTPLEVARVNGQLLDPATAATLIQRVTPLLADLDAPHYLEAWMAVALLALADCDAAVIEVGMGGRYDRTNALDPQVSAITTVNYDHLRLLGGSLERIAWHKAGIMRPGRPTILGDIPPQARAVIEAEAADRLPLVEAEDLSGAAVGLKGAHQVRNAGVAVAATRAFAAACNMPWQEATMRSALAEVRFAGRLETVEQRPRIILDGAHNDEKVAAMLAALRESFQYDRLIVVLGMLASRQVEGIMQRFAPVTDVMIATATPVKGKPSYTARDLAGVAQSAGIEAVHAVNEPEAAIEAARTHATPGDLIVVTGSLYLVGRVRALWYPTHAIEAARTMFPA